MPQVEKTRTTLDPAEAVGIIRELAPALTPCAVRILAAQSDLETGTWRSMFNWNWGGIKSTSETQNYFVSPTKEREGGELVTVQGKFRAYDSARRGAVEWLDLLERRYAAALDAARECDLMGFVRGLKERGYFTEHEHLYADRVHSRLDSLTRSGAFDALGPGAPTEPPLSGGEGSVRSRSWGSASVLSSLQPERLAVLRVGAVGADVALVQYLVNADPVDGLFGPVTERAVRTYQTRRMLLVDGIVGPITWGVFVTEAS